MKLHTIRSRSGASLVVTGALGLLLAACGSSNPSATARSSGGVILTAISSAGTNQLATGSPIDIQMPNLQGSTEGVNLPATSQAAQAAVDWINHHGGVQGHVLKLTVCDLLTTPASDVACANSMAAAHPVAVVAGAVDNATPIVTALAAAKTPYVGLVSNAPIEQTSPDAFSFSAGDNGAYYVVAKNEQKLGGKKVALVLIGAPGAVAASEKQAAPTFKLGGQSVTVVLTSPTGQADLTPTIQAATSGGTTAVFLNEDPTTCIAGLNAKGTLQITSARFYADGSCESEQVVSAAGANAEGTYFASPADESNRKDADYSTYTQAMNKYAAGVSHVGFSPEGYVPVMDLYRIMETIPSGTPITSASVTTALRNAKSIPAFLGAGTTLTCNGKQVPQESSLCSGSFFLERYTGGKFSYVGRYTLPKS